MSTLQQKVEALEKVGAGDLSPAHPSYFSCLWTYRIEKWCAICTLSPDTVVVAYGINPCCYIS
jgi:hypothetical protein